MTDLNSMLAREETNKNKIYLYYWQDKWITCGQSAHRLKIICLHTQTLSLEEETAFIPCVSIDTEVLLDISPRFPISIGDDFMEIDVSDL